MTVDRPEVDISYALRHVRSATEEIALLSDHVRWRSQALAECLAAIAAGAPGFGPPGQKPTDDFIRAKLEQLKDWLEACLNETLCETNEIWKH